MEGCAATIVRVCEFISSNLVVVAAGSSETQLNFCQNTWHHTQKDSNPCSHYHENLASDLNYISDFGTDIASSHVICPEIVKWKCVAIAPSKNTNIIVQPSFIT
jgi:hypothetical protein